MNPIKFFRKKAGLSQSDLAQKMNVVQGTVSLWESGKRSPSLEDIIKLSEILSISPENLLKSDISTTEENFREINIKSVPEFTEEAFTVPVVASLRCGYNSSGHPIFDVLKKEELPPSYKKRYGADIVLVKAVGDSMLPSIRPRDMLICKPGTGWSNGDIVVVNVDDSDTIKRIFHAKDGGIDLKPDNEKFKTMHFTPEDLVNYPPHVLGRVVRNYGQDL